MLEMIGGFVDTIVKVGMSHAEHPEAELAASHWPSLFDRLKEAEVIAPELTVYPNGESVQAAFRTTMVMSTRTCTTRASKVFADEYPRARDVLEKWSSTGPYSLDEGYLEAQSYRQQLAVTFQYMRFCVTGKGYMGLCTANATAGDVVYILHGMHAPYTMRKTAGRDDQQLRLVGQCYIHGIMDGEALTLPGYKPRNVYIW
jgi:hypothetical protein